MERNHGMIVQGVEEDLLRGGGGEGGNCSRGGDAHSSSICPGRAFHIPTPAVRSVLGLDHKIFTGNAGKI